jgi:hypothetical protein
MQFSGSCNVPNVPVLINLNSSSFSNFFGSVQSAFKTLSIFTKSSSKGLGLITVLIGFSGYFTFLAAKPVLWCFCIFLKSRPTQYPVCLLEKTFHK